MSNTLLTPSVIAKEMMLQFKNSLSFAKNVNKQYDDQFAVKGAKIGSSITIRKPVRYLVSDGATMTTQDATEESASLSLSSQKHVGISFTSKELALSIDEFSDRFIQPAMLSLANQVDVDLLTLAANSVYNAVGTPATTPATLLTYLQARQKLTENACPQDNNRSIHINPLASATIVDALKGLFQSSEQISNQYEMGKMGKSIGADWYESQNVLSHTGGQLGGTPLVNGVPASGATTLVTDGWTAAAANRVKAGDIFTIAGVYSVNPITKVSTGQLQQFVVTADASSSAGGAATISISPAINSTVNSLQNVSAAPADNAALTFKHTASQVYANNIMMHKNAFILGCADLQLPGGVDFAAQATDKDSGLSLRMVRQYAIGTDTFPCRVDILYGTLAARPEWACKIIG